MGVERPDLIATLVTEEIRRIVADGIADGSLVSASVAASQILRVYPTCGLSKRQVTDSIIMAAGAAGVAVEFGEQATPEAHPEEAAHTSPRFPGRAKRA